MIFDGKQFARQLEDQLHGKLVGKKVIAVLDPSNPASVTYTNLKKKTADRLGVEFVISHKFIDDPDADGILIQLPFPNSDSLIKLINPKQDIDGLREDSLYKPAVVNAVLKILPTREGKIVIVGSKGEVGKRLLNELSHAIGVDKGDSLEILKDADVIISATGQAGLIKPEMVKEGLIAIDVGYPKGDFDPAVANKASFFTPVPGGVGPVTVVMLFHNLLK